MIFLYLMSYDDDFDHDSISNRYDLRFERNDSMRGWDARDEESTPNRYAYNDSLCFYD